MQRDFDTLETVFGTSWWEGALFYSHENALRFELGQGEFWLERFESAALRAQGIMNTLFPSGSDLRLFVVRYRDRAATAVDKDTAALEESLETYGLSVLDEFESCVVPGERFDAESECWIGSVSICIEHLSRVAWASVATDFPSLPPPPGKLFVVCSTNRVLSSIYDDRGMDIIAADAAQIRHVYKAHADWLLAHDREHMDRLFKA